MITSEKEYKTAIECRNYVDRIIKRVQSKLDKVQEEHNQGFDDYSDKIRKLDHEIYILKTLKEAPCETISCYLAEKRGDML